MGETPKRIISGLSIAAVFIFCLSYQGMYMLPLYLFVVAANILGIREFIRMAKAKTGETIAAWPLDTYGLTWLTLVWLAWQQKYYVAGAPLYSEQVAVLLKFIRLNYPLIGGILFFFFFAVIKLQLLRNRIENSFFVIAFYVLAFLYIPFTCGHLFLLYGLEHGLFYVWLVAWGTTMADTAAYFMGKAFGRNKVGFAVSPNKTYEGYILGCLLQVGLVMLFYAVASANFTVPQYSYIEIAISGFIIYLASVLGDLTESLLKRDAGVKDSGALIPGHGGVLDLLDALFITIPAAYYYFYVLQELKAA